MLVKELKDQLLRAQKKEIIARVIIVDQKMKVEVVLNEMIERVLESHLRKKSLKAQSTEVKEDLIVNLLRKMQLLERIQ